MTEWGCAFITQERDEGMLSLRTTLLVSILLAVVSCSNITSIDPDSDAKTPPHKATDSTCLEGELLWQIGTFDQLDTEYPTCLGHQCETFYPVFTYVTNGIDLEPTFPGNIAHKSTSHFVDPGNFNRHRFDTAQVVVIKFEVLDSRNLVFRYDRFGSEDDELFFDGQTMGIIEGDVADIPGATISHVFDLGRVDPGDHRLRIEYRFGGGNNGHGVDALSLVALSETAEIDVRPRTPVNVVNPRSRGYLPVAILSDSGFDATEIDVSSLLLGPGSASPHHMSQVRDIDHDGDLDLVVRFRVRDIAIECGSSSLCLEGTANGIPFSGSDSIRTVGCTAIELSEGF